MAISIDWGTKVITVPRADMLLIQSSPTEIRQLSLDAFRLELKDLEDSDYGMAYLATHNHVAPITVGGVTLARVVEIINGYTVTFEDGQYAVNLVGANSNVADVTNVNQVSVRSANSAGLTFSDQINQQSFAGFVWIDTQDGLSGTQFPRGTPSDPVDNWADAETIATSLRFESFKLRHSLTMPASEDLREYTIEGLNPVGSQIIFQGGQFTNFDMKNLSFGGNMGSGYFAARNCIIGALTDMEGGLFECVVNGNIQLSATPTGSADISFMNCVSGFPGDVAFTLDCNGTTAGIQFRNWSGGMVIDNFSGGDFMSIDVAQGKITINATCTAGTILIRGNAEVIDNSGGGCNVITSGVTVGKSEMASVESRIIGAMP